MYKMGLKVVYSGKRLGTTVPWHSICLLFTGECAAWGNGISDEAACFGLLGKLIDLNNAISKRSN